MGGWGGLVNHFRRHGRWRGERRRRDTVRDRQRKEVGGYCGWRDGGETEGGGRDRHIVIVWEITEGICIVKTKQSVVASYCFRPSETVL